LTTGNDRAPSVAGPSRSGHSPRLVWVGIVAVHLLGFALLYVAVDRLFRGELVNTYAAESAGLLREAIQDLQPAMVHQDGAEFDVLLREFGRDHMLREIEITPLPLPAAESAAAAEIVDLLRSGEAARLRFETVDGRSLVRGLARIDSADECRECHGDVDPIAVVAATRDVTDQLGDLEQGLRLTVLLLVGGWAAIVIVSGTMLRRASVQSAACVRADLEAAERGGPASETAATDLALDPVTAQIHQALRSFLARERERRSSETSGLQRAQALASLGKVAAGLAHEIKNPVAGLQGALEILHDRCENVETRGVYKQMLGELQRINKTVQSLLDLSRPAKPNRAPTDLGELVGEIVSLMEPTLTKRRLEISLELASGALVARVDGGQIRQVVVNLLQNAAEALGDGGEITVRVAPVEEQGGVLIAVTDNGPGIPEESLAIIFEPFHTTKSAGTGLGLAIARTLVRQNDGELEVESVVGQGSTFLIMLGDEHERETRA